MSRVLIYAGLLALVALGAMPVQAAMPAQVSSVSAVASDREVILQMAGNYRVRFDFRETTSWRDGYTPIAAKLSGGNEVVRVVENTARRIVLQHLLVVTVEGKSMIIKHWRQDWDYEPAQLLVYAGQGRWTLQPVPRDRRRGRWSQTVWQTDDSPRYAGLGDWANRAGVRSWQSDDSWRPLARRDAVRKPPYDRYLSINRHAISPAGWVHWQDNTKMGIVAGAVVPFVQESVLNTYTKSDAYDVKAADDYWAATKDYWALVRAEWDAIIRRGKGVVVKEVAETGSDASERLMGWADDIQAGKLTTADAIVKAKAVMAEVSS